jgi:AcrR family transcriptional regulator
MQSVTKGSADACPRPYSVAQRQAGSDRKRARVLAIARAQLESNGFRDFSLESIARQSGITRQTVYNLFGSRAGLLEALFDQLAMAGGMERMRHVMQKADSKSALSALIDVFCEFWAKDRLLIRRIHGIAAIDPEFGAAVEARNRRRQGAVARILQRLDAEGSKRTPAEQSQQAAAVYALTSFEFFDVLADAIGVREAAPVLRRLVISAIAGSPATL